MLLYGRGLFLQHVYQLGGDVHDANRVSETRTFCTLKGEKGNTQLMNTAQALEFAGINEVHDQAFSRHPPIQDNVLVNRVEIGPLVGHVENLFLRKPRAGTRKDRNPGKRSRPHTASSHIILGI